MVYKKWYTHVLRHIFQSGGGQHFTWEIDRFLCACRRLEAAERYVDLGAVCDRTADVVDLDERGAAVLIVVDNVRAASPAIDNRGGFVLFIIEPAVDPHIFAETVAGFVLHFDPDAHQIAARQRGNRPYFNTVVLDGDAGDRLALFGKAAEHVFQSLSQSGYGSGQRGKSQ